MSGQDYESPAPNHWLHQLLTLGVEKNIMICTKFVQNIKAIILCKTLNQIWAKQMKSTFNAYTVRVHQVQYNGAIFNKQICGLIADKPCKHKHIS
jgi:hypothetical protein